MDLSSQVAICFHFIIRYFNFGFDPNCFACSYLINDKINLTKQLSSLSINLFQPSMSAIYNQHCYIRGISIWTNIFVCTERISVGRYYTRNRQVYYFTWAKALNEWNLLIAKSTFGPFIRGMKNREIVSFLK